MAILTVFSVLTRCLGFIFRIVLSRTLSSELLGVYSIGVSIFMVFATMLNSGLPLALSKTTASCTVDKNYKKAHRYVTSGLIISLTVSLFAVVFILVSKSLFIKLFTNDTTYTLLILLIPAIVFTGIYAPFRGYLWGKENYFKVSIVEFVENVIRISVCFCIFMIINDTNNILPAGIAVSIACILSTILGITFFFHSKGRLGNPKGHYSEIIKTSAPITGVRVASSLMQPIVAVILPYLLMSCGFTNDQALSQIGIAMGMALPLLSIPGTIIGSLATALIPKITGLVKEKNDLQLKKQINTSLVFTIICCFITLPAFIALGEPICEFLFNNITAGVYIKYTCWIIIPMGISQLTTSILNSLGLETKMFKYYLVSAVVLLLCVLIMPQFIGIYALMYGTGLSTAVIAFLNLRKINKTLNTKGYQIKLISKLFLIGIPVAILTHFIFELLIPIFPVFINIILSGIISVVSYALLMCVFNIIDIHFIQTHVNSKNKAKIKN